MGVVPAENVCAENAVADGDAEGEAEGLDGEDPPQAIVAASAIESAEPITILVIAKKLRGAM